MMETSLRKNWKASTNFKSWNSKSAWHHHSHFIFIYKLQIYHANLNKLHLLSYPALSINIVSILHIVLIVSIWEYFFNFFCFLFFNLHLTLHFILFLYTIWCSLLCGLLLTSPYWFHLRSKFKWWIAFHYHFNTAGAKHSSKVWEIKMPRFSGLLENDTLPSVIV